MGRLPRWARLIRSAQFAIRTRDEASLLAGELSLLFPDISSTTLALTELLLNAVEHGNLGIGGELKGELLRRGALEQEIERRLALPALRDRVVLVSLTCLHGQTSITIRDEGGGFDWRAQLAKPDLPSLEPNGRGLALVRSVSCVRVEFNQIGNTVTVKAAS